VKKKRMKNDLHNTLRVSKDSPFADAGLVPDNGTNVPKFALVPHNTEATSTCLLPSCRQYFLSRPTTKDARSEKHLRHKTENQDEKLKTNIRLHPCDLQWTAANVIVESIHAFPRENFKIHHTPRIHEEQPA
jgi:hypothetical protein